MKTYRITEEEIKGLKPVAVGYKIFRNDWTSNQGYDYKDENGNVLGTIHKVDGKIEECQWGLHFSKKPQDCFNFYECVQWNKFAKVEAYDKCIDARDGKKSVANILKIVEIYSFDEFIKLIQEDLQNVNRNGINESCGINGSDGINGSYGINGSDGINESCGINGSSGINGSDGINRSSGINESCGINGSSGINGSYGINRSSGINESCGINRSSGINRSDGINGSSGINWSCGINWSYGIVKCEGLSRCIFCYNQSGKLMAFNKKITEARFNEIFDKLKSFDWYPKFNNAFDLKGNLEWYETNIPAIVKVNNKTAWSFMPKEMLGYIKSLPEYNEKIFEKITGDIEND